MTVKMDIPVIFKEASFRTPTDIVESHVPSPKQRVFQRPRRDSCMNLVSAIGSSGKTYPPLTDPKEGMLCRLCQNFEGPSQTFRGAWTVKGIAKTA